MREGRHPGPVALVAALVVALVVTSVVTVLVTTRDERAPGEAGPTSSPSGTAAPRPPSELTLTQYNVRNRDDAVRTALAGRPHLLGLNEAGRLVSAYRSVEVPSGYTLTAATTGDRDRRQNAVLTAPEVRVLSSRTVQLSAAVPGAAYARDRWALVVEVELADGARHVHVQTHLNPGVRRYADDDPRAQAYAASVERLDLLLDDLDDAPSLTVAGDMNLAADSERAFAWAPVLRRHDLRLVAQGLDVVGYRGLARPGVVVLPRGVSDHPAITTVFGGVASPRFVSE